MEFEKEVNIFTKNENISSHQLFSILLGNTFLMNFFSQNIYFLFLKTCYIVFALFIARGGSSGKTRGMEILGSVKKWRPKLVEIFFTSLLRQDLEGMTGGG